MAKLSQVNKSGGFIQNSWNAPQGKVTIGKTTYSVVFKIKGEYSDSIGESVPL